MNRDFEDLGGADPYELLGVPPDAGTADIERAYRRLALRTHPDTGGDEESQKWLNLAREVLLDPVRRMEMDRRLRQRRGEDDEITEEPPRPQPEPEPEPYEDQFDWTYGTSPSPSPPKAPPAQDAPPEREWMKPPPAPPPPYQWPPYHQPVYREPVYQQPAYRYPAPPGYPYRRRWNGLAIASFVVSLVCWPVALPMAVMALGQVRRRNERGAGLAWTAIAIGSFALLCAVVIGAGRI